jgi:hypothetical protein
LQLPLAVLKREVQHIPLRRLDWCQAEPSVVRDAEIVCEPTLPNFGLSNSDAFRGND